MNRCNLRIKWLDDIDRLSDEELDELIEHAGFCDDHNELLTEYEQSFLPVLRAAMPEKCIAYRPASPGSRIWTFFEDLHFSISDFVCRIIIVLYQLISFINYHVKAFVIKILSDFKPLLSACATLLLFFVTFVAAYVLITSEVLFNNTGGGRNPEDASITGSDIRPQPVPQTIVSLTQPDLFAEAGGKPAPTKPASKKPAKKLNNSYHVDISAVTTPKVDEPLLDSKVSTESVKSISAPDQEVSSTTLEQYDKEKEKEIKKVHTVPVSTALSYILPYPKPEDTQYANFKIKLVNLTAKERGRTTCTVISAKQPLVKLVLTLSSNGICNWGLLPAGKYDFLVETPDYHPVSFSVNIVNTSPKSQIIDMKTVATLK